MNRILRILLASLLFLMAIISAILIVVFKNNKQEPHKGGFSYAKADTYQAGNAFVDASQVKNVEINWISGSITLDSLSSSNKVSFQETAKNRIDEDELLHWKMDGSTLIIQWCKNGIKGPNYGKNLEVSLPSSLSLDGISINGVSADVLLKDIHTNSLAVNSVSGDVELNRGIAGKSKVDSVSGNIRLAYLETPTTITIDTVSGNATITLPKDTGFTAQVSSISGDFRSSIPTTKDEKRYEAGDGSVKITMGSVSGNLKVTY